MQCAHQKNSAIIHFTAVFSSQGLLARNVGRIFCTQPRRVFFHVLVRSKQTHYDVVFYGRGCWHAKDSSQVVTCHWAASVNVLVCCLNALCNCKMLHCCHICKTILASCIAVFCFFFQSKETYYFLRRNMPRPHLKRKSNHSIQRLKQYFWKVRIKLPTAKMNIFLLHIKMRTVKCFTRTTGWQKSSPIAQSANKTSFSEVKAIQKIRQANVSTVILAFFCTAVVWMCEVPVEKKNKIT